MSHSKLKTILLDKLSKWPDWQGLTELQKEFFRKFFQHKNIFLTGPAGVGKSFAVELLFRFLDSEGIFYGKTATTGVAALNIGGTTINSWSGMGLADDNGEDLLNKVAGNSKAVNRIKAAKVLVIDEISMAKAELLEKLDIVCQVIRDKEQPFGGIQVVFVGDFMQLPPVFKGFEKEAFAFDSQAWIEAKVVTVHLTEIVRQHDEPEFAAFLNKIRMGQTTDLTMLKECIDRQFPDDGIKPVELFCKNIDVNGFNLKELDKIEGMCQVYRATDEASESWSQFFDKNCPAPTRLELKKGAQVMLLINLDVAQGLVNGSVGVVEKTYSDCVEVRFEDGVHVIEPYKWEIKQNEFDKIAGKMKKTVLATRRQLPLKLAWAVTVHKCVHENSIVHLKNSSKRIKNLGDDYTYSVKNGYNKIEKIYQTEKQDAMKITLKSGREIICSTNHQLAVAYSLSNIRFEEALNIKEGDKLLSKVGFPTPTISPISTEMCWILGALVGDGSYSKDDKDYRVDFCNIPSECGETYKKLMETLMRVKISLTKENGSKARCYYFHNKSARLLLKSYGLDYTKRDKKHVPEIIFECSREGIANFLCGLIDTDGHINTRNMVITNVSKRLLQEVQTLFSILGYKSSIYNLSPPKSPNHNQAYNLILIGHQARSFLKEFSHHLKAMGKYKHLSRILAYPHKKIKVQNNDLSLTKEEVEKLKQELIPRFGKKYGLGYRIHIPNSLSDYLQEDSSGMNRYVLERFVKEIPGFSDLGTISKDITSAILSNLYFDEVTSIEPLVDQPLIDITVENEHTYFAEGLFHHNCQGSTLNRASVNIADAFADGMVYVSLSRVRSLKALRLKPFSANRIMVNKKCLDFYKQNEEDAVQEDPFFET